MNEMCEKYGLGSKLCILQGPVETRGPAASRAACHGCRGTLRSTPNRPSERGRRGLLAGPRTAPPRADKCAAYCPDAWE